MPNQISEEEAAVEQSESARWVTKWLENWHSLGKDPRAYIKRREAFRELVKMGQAIPPTRPLVSAVVRALGAEASEFVQLCYIEAGRPPVKN